MNRDNALIGSIVKKIDFLSETVGKLISYILIITIAATVIEVVARYIFKSPTVWAYEVEMYTCGALYVLIGAYCQLKKSHVSVDLLYQLAGKKTRRILRLTINFPLILIFTGALAYMGGQFAWNSISIGERSYTAWAPYIWPVKLMLPVGCVLLMLQAVSDFLRDLFLWEGESE